MISKTMTGSIAKRCKPDYLLEEVWYEDVDVEFAEERCRGLCWKDLHVNSFKVERIANRTDYPKFVSVVCYCDQNECG